MRYYQYGLLVSLLSGCGIGSTMEGIKSEISTMKGSVSDLSDSLSATGSAIKSQGVAMALGECMKPENLQFIQLTSVIPASIIPCSKAFGEMATEEQIAGLGYLWFIDLNQGLIDAFTEEEKNKSDLFKLRRLMVLETIVGMLTPEKTKALYALSGGQYASAIMGLMALRYQFISTFLLETGVLAKDHPNQAELEAGQASIKDLRDLEELGKQNPLNIKLLGFFSADLNQTISVENRSDELEEKLKAKGEHYVRTANESVNF